MKESRASMTLPECAANSPIAPALRIFHALAHREHLLTGVGVLGDAVLACEVA